MPGLPLPWTDCCYAHCGAAGTWAKDVQAEDWAGLAVASVLDIDVTEEPGKTRVKNMLKE